MFSDYANISDIMKTCIQQANLYIVYVFLYECKRYKMPHDIQNILICNINKGDFVIKIIKTNYWHKGQQKVTCVPLNQSTWLC